MHIYILNYDICYTSHPDFNFAIYLDENPSFRVQSVIGSIVEGVNLDEQLSLFMWYHTLSSKLTTNLTLECKV